GPVGPVSLSMAREAVVSITLDWSPVTAKRLKVVRSFADLPQDIQRKERAKGATGNEKGIFHDANNVFVFADNHTSVADIEATVFDEAYGHLGFAGLFGKDIVRKMDELLLMAVKPVQPVQVNPHHQAKPDGDKKRQGKVDP